MIDVPSDPILREWIEKDWTTFDEARKSGQIPHAPHVHLIHKVLAHLQAAHAHLQASQHEPALRHLKRAMTALDHIGRASGPEGSNPGLGRFGNLAGGFSAVHSSVQSAIPHVNALLANPLLQHHAVAASQHIMTAVNHINTIMPMIQPLLKSEQDRVDLEKSWSLFDLLRKMGQAPPIAKPAGGPVAATAVGPKAGKKGGKKGKLSHTKKAARHLKAAQTHLKYGHHAAAITHLKSAHHAMAAAKTKKMPIPKSLNRLVMHTNRMAHGGFRKPNGQVAPPAPHAAHQLLSSMSGTSVSSPNISIGG